VKTSKGESYERIGSRITGNTARDERTYRMRKSSEPGFTCGVDFGWRAARGEKRHGGQVPRRRGAGYR